MIAFISPNELINNSLRRYLIFNCDYKKESLIFYSFININLPKLKQTEEVYIITGYNSNVSSNYYFSFVLYTLLQHYLSDTSIYVLNFDLNQDFRDKLPYDAEKVFLKKFTFVNLCDVDSSRTIIKSEIVIKEWSENGFPDLRYDPHKMEFANIINSILLLKGAFLDSEIDSDTFFETIYAIIRDYRLMEKSLSQEKAESIIPLLSLSRIDTKKHLRLNNFVKDKNVLLVDDHCQFGWGQVLSSILNLNLVFINNENYPNHYNTKNINTLFCCSSINQAFSFLELTTNVRLIFIDLYMPDASGFDLLKKIQGKGELNTSNIIFSSSYGATTIIKALDENWADSYFCKTIYEHNSKNNNKSIEGVVELYFSAFRDSIKRSLFKNVIRFRSRSEFDVYKHIEIWIKQFPKETKKYAFKLLENIKFYDTKKIQDRCKNVHQLLRQLLGNKINDIFLMGVGSASKSGNHILYYYRQQNFTRTALKKLERKRSVFISLYELPNLSILDSIDKNKDFYKKNKIILIDDLLGSGNQFCEEFGKIIEHLPFLKDKEFEDTFYYLALLGFKNGIDHIVSKYPRFKNRIIVGEFIEEQHQAFSTITFPVDEDRENAKEQIKQISIENKLYSRKGEQLPFGYNNDSLLVIWEHNTPNNTLPIFWSTMNGWKPLFERKE